jgi:hypothetical protein
VLVAVVSRVGESGNRACGFVLVEDRTLFSVAIAVLLLGDGAHMAVLVAG